MSPAVLFAGSRNRRRFGRSWNESTPLAESWWTSQWWAKDIRSSGMEWHSINQQGGS